MTATEHKKVMNASLLKLNETYTDKATMLEGNLTHVLYGMGHIITYLFQPKGLGNDGQPLKKIPLSEGRLMHSNEDFERVEIPTQLLGTTAKDKTSGYTGTVIELVRDRYSHFQLLIQMKGLSPLTGAPHEPNMFNLLDCEVEIDCTPPPVDGPFLFGTFSSADGSGR